MTNSYTTSKTFDGNNEDVRAALRYAIRRIASINVIWGDRTVTFNLAPSFLLSWGEKVQIQIDSDTTVEISSKCSAFFQLHDGGKNESNIVTILEWMDEYYELWKNRN